MPLAAVSTAPHAFNTSQILVIAFSCCLSPATLRFPTATSPLLPRIRFGILKHALHGSRLGRSLPFPPAGSIPSRHDVHFHFNCALAELCLAYLNLDLAAYFDAATPDYLWI